MYDVILPRSAFEGYFDRIVKITGGIQIAEMSTYNGAFTLAKLQHVRQQIYLYSMRYVKTIAFDALVETTGITVQCADYSILESISFKMLNNVDGDFRVNSSPSSPWLATSLSKASLCSSPCPCPSSPQ